MGYYASGFGKATLKYGINKCKLQEILDDVLEKAFGLEYDFDHEGNIEFSDSENYHEEDVLDFLNALSPYIVDGEIKYSGDADSHWKFVFNKKTGGWDESSGAIYYSLIEFPDDVLVEELERRGYKVTEVKI